MGTGLGAPRNGNELFRPGVLLVQPKPGPAAVEELRLLHQVHGVVVERVLRGSTVEMLTLPGAADVEAMALVYAQSGLVEVAEPDYWLEVAAVSNDPGFLAGLQWGLHNTGQSGGMPDADIDAPDTWLNLTDASGVVVAVVDTGVRHTHEDLAGNMWVNPGEIAGNGLDDDLNGFIDDVHGIDATAMTGNSSDAFGHGTFVAGVLGAVGGNGVGIAGVAWDLQIMSCKFIDAQGYGTLSSAITAINYARTEGADIINASFVMSMGSALLRIAIQDCRSAGIPVVAASGNAGTDNDTTPYYPASYTMDNIVAVMATQRTDSNVGYNYGATSVDLAAPGYAIHSTYSGSDQHYATGDGTSYAAPFVTGALALMKARYPSENHQSLIARLLESVDPLPSLAGKCVTGGRLNLARATESDTAVPANLQIASAAGGGVEVQVVGTPFQTYRLEFTVNFVDWAGVFTNTAPASGSFIWTDAGAVSPFRSYRATAISSSP